MREKVVVLDLDDTCLDFVGYLCLLHNKQHKTTLTRYDLKEYQLPMRSEHTNLDGDIVSKSLYKTFKDYEGHGLYTLLPVIAESKQAMNIFRLLNYKVIIMTARDPKFRKQTELHLMHHDLPYDEVYFSKEKATTLNELAEKYEIVAFVDDKAETILSVNEKCKIENICLMDQPQNRKTKLPRGVVRINNLIELVNKLREV